MAMKRDTDMLKGSKPFKIHYGCLHCNMLKSLQIIHCHKIRIKYRLNFK